jgi:hypothetical protein
MFANQAAGSEILITAYAEEHMFTKWQEWRDTNRSANSKLWTNTVGLNNLPSFRRKLHEIFPVEQFQFKANQRSPPSTETAAQKKERLARIKKCLKFSTYKQLRDRFAEFVQTGAFGDRVPRPARHHASIGGRCQSGHSK